MAVRSAYAFVCTTTMTERDGVTSAIRIVDTFYIPAVPDRAVLPAVAMALYLSIQLTRDDDSPHTLSVTLIRPDGDRHSFTIVENTPAPTAKIDVPYKNFNAAGQLSVDPRQMGTHEFAVYLDDQQVTSAFFTLEEGQTTNVEELPS